METFSCQHCSLNFSSIEQAVDHVHSYRLAEKPCVVPGCTQSFPNLTRHVKRSHPSQCKFACDLCGKLFVHDYSLQQHKRDVQDCTIKKKRKRRPRKKKQPPAVYTPSTFLESAYYHNPFTTTHLNFYLKEMEISGKSQPTATVTHTDPVDFRSPVTATNLNRFINDNLQPTEEFNQEMKQTVKQICDFLQEHMKPNQIVKGGSLGKGTAVKGKSDIDLVLVLNDVKDGEDLKEKLPGIKKQIIDKLRRNAQSFTIVPNSISETRFSVKFSVQGTHEKIDVDLLPTFHFSDLKSLYRKMRDDKRHVEYCSASLVEQQVDFVEKYPANVKNLIRLVKYWKKEMVPSEGSRRIPTSYVMELITIHLWEENNDGTFNTLKAFHGVMDALKNCESLNVIWTKNYMRYEIPDEIRSQRPLVMDPANPMNNVCSRFEWEQIRREAKEVLDSPMLREVSSTSWK